jgi:transposase InsO family protein
MDVDFCVVTLEEAIARHGKPDIFNTDQGSQFTSFAFTATLKDAGIRISVEGRGRWIDNVFIKRLWRSLKYECVLPQRPRDKQRGSDGHQLMDRLLPRATFTFDLRRQGTRRGLCCGGNNGAIGGVETHLMHLSQAPNCLTKRNHLIPMLASHR